MPEVKDPALLELLNGGSAAPAYPGVIAGRPKIAPAPTPFQIEDQNMQRARDARQAAEWAASHNPDGSEKPKIVTDGKPTEYQAKSAGFLGRMIQAENFYKTVPAESRDPRAAAGQTMHEWAPDLENSLPVWLGGNSPDRQKADQAALNFIRASLRQESGAAIGSAEEIQQYRMFFPMPGDDDAVLKQKALARQQAIEGFRIAAGPLAKSIEVDPSKPLVKSGRTGVSYNFEVPEGADDAAILAAAKAFLAQKEPGETRDPIFDPPRGPASSAPAQGGRLRYNPATGELE